MGRQVSIEDRARAPVTMQPFDQQLALLGNSRHKLSRIGLGTWQFTLPGGKLSDHWAPLDQATCNDIVAAAMACGINWFDTAEAYGDGSAEIRLATALSQVTGRNHFIASKWWPRGKSASAIENDFQASTRRLQPHGISLYQIHHPDSESSLNDELNSLFLLKNKHDNLCIGLSNYGAPDLEKACQIALDRGSPLSAIQVRYSLLNRAIEQNGILDIATKYGLSVIAWSPLEQGILSGRFHRDRSGIKLIRASRLQGMKRKIRRSGKLIAALQQVADNHDASAAQVALAWILHKSPNLMVLAGASNPQQVKENAGAMQISLSVAEMALLEKASRTPLLYRLTGRAERLISRGA